LEKKFRLFPTTKTFEVTIEDVKDPNSSGMSTVTLDLNGEKQKIEVKAKQPKLHPFIKRKAGTTVTASQEQTRKKTDKSIPGNAGAPLPGKVENIKAKVGDTVKKGDVVVVLSSMKLQIEVTAPITGKITSLHVGKTDMVSAGDLLFEMN